MELCSHCSTKMTADSAFCPNCGTPAAGGDAGGLLASSGSDPTGFLDRLRAATVGEFTIIRELGRGGMSRVYLAHELALDRRVAMKVLPPELAEHTTVVRRFQREARTAGKLSHPHIVPVHQVSERAGINFFTMPYVAGPSLRQLLRQTPQLSVEVGRRYLGEAAEALAYAHEQGVIHRDIKPENMLFEGSRDGRLLLTDFGIAKALGSATTLTRPGDVMGTPYFMSPEQCEERDAIDGRSDQYSLGLVGYEMLAGRFPFSADSLAGIVYKHLHEYPEPLANIRPDIPADLLGVIERAYRKDPDERFPSMREMLEELGAPRLASPASRSWAAARPAPARAKGTASGPGRSGRRLIGASAVLIGAVALGFAIWQASDLPERGDVGLAELDVPIPSGEPAAAEALAVDSLTDDEKNSAAPLEGGDAKPARRALPTTPKTPPPEREEAIDPMAPLRAQAVLARGEAEQARDSARRSGADTIFPQRFAEIDRRLGTATSQLLSGQLVRAAMVYGGVRQDFDQLRRQTISQLESSSVADSGAVETVEIVESPPPPTDRDTAVVPSERAIAVLLDRYRQALEGEDLQKLSRDVYRGSIPEDDLRLFNGWFDPAEDLIIRLEVERLQIAELEGTAEARVKQHMEFKLRRTAEKRSPVLGLELSFARVNGVWRLRRVEGR